MQIHSIHLLTLLVGTKLFGDDITCVEVDEMIKRKTPEMAVATDSQLHQFACLFTGMILSFPSYKTKKIFVEFPTRCNENIWREFFKYEDGKFIVLVGAMKELYTLYIALQRFYPLPVVRQAVKMVK